MESGADRRAEVESTVRAFLANRLGIARDEVRLDASFVESGFDSLDSIDLLMAVEDEFGITFNTSVLPKLQTGAQLVDMIVEASSHGSEDSEDASATDEFTADPDRRRP